MKKLGRPFPPMTPPQRKILTVIKKNPNASVREWAKATGYKFDTIRPFLMGFVNKGYLTTTPPKARAYKITKKALEEL